MHSLHVEPASDRQLGARWPTEDSAAVRGEEGGAFGIQSHRRVLYLHHRSHLHHVRVLASATKTASTYEGTAQAEDFSSFFNTAAKISSTPTLTQTVHLLISSANENETFQSLTLLDGDTNLLNKRL